MGLRTLFAPLVPDQRLLTKTLLVMRLTAILLLVACIKVGAVGHAQTITLSEKNAPLEKIFGEVKKQTGYGFFFESGLLQETKNVDIHVTKASLEDVLEICFRNQSLTFTIVGKTILIKAGLVTPALTFPDLPPPPAVLKGRIADNKTGAPLTDASIVVKGTKTGTHTNSNGEFTLNVNFENKIVLVISFIGYEKKEVTVTDVALWLDIQMKVSEESMADVVVSTGMFKRKRESFTGASSTFSGDQLRMIGNQNVIQSLKTLDPSFNVLENNLLGSNPNALPTIELRGKTTVRTSDLNSRFVTDPNQPLFVLNGFETTLEVVNNLNMNQIASLSVLKDASSTALYGPRAANGVVVIETVKPIPGKIRVDYTGDFTVSAPDLRSYNMMNASEKLEFEKKAGLYTAPSYASPSLQQDYDNAYNNKLAEVARGVNTYWIGMPVRTGFSQGHTLNFTGGSPELSFGMMASYKKVDGVMKGSGKQIMNGSIDLTYRKRSININNVLMVQGTKGDESPYGSFSDFVSANPYYRKYDTTGSIYKYINAERGTTFYTTTNGINFLTAHSTEGVLNPLYNSTLPYINQSKYFFIQNSTTGIWDISRLFRLEGRVMVNKGTTTDIVYLAPERKEFDGKPALEKGSYTYGTTDRNEYLGNLSFIYTQLLGGKHQLNGLFRTGINELKNNFIGFSAVGFPNGSNGNPKFANSYTPSSAPDAANVTTRGVNFITNFNYVYDRRYVLEATFTRTGESAFGVKNAFKNNWAVGASWNINNESFLIHSSWIQMLKLRGNVGYSGNEVLGSFIPASLYTSTTSGYIFGPGLGVTSVGNPDLKAQNTLQTSVGIDFSLFGNRFGATVNYYDKSTDPQIIGATDLYPSSAGLEASYPMNLGSLTATGWEVNIRAVAIDNKKDFMWVLWANGASVRTEYSGFGNTLEAFNKEELNTGGLSRYYDGTSPEDVWAVKSLGIDPATGYEMFQKKDGTQTMMYSTDDIVKVGNTRPKVQGVLGTTFSYKAFSMNVAMRFRIAGYVMNDALFNSVENLNTQSIRMNQDARALYERWNKPGDVSEFRGIRIDEYTPISSRFLQKDSHLEGETISLNYDFGANSWIRKLSMKQLRLTLYSMNYFRWTTVQYPRGTDYPFSYQFSFRINASF